MTTTTLRSTPVIVFARGSITDRDALAPHRDEETRAVAQLKADGVMKAAYRRSAEPGVYVVLEGSSIDAVAERVNTLPFVAEGLMTLDHEEIHEI
jgi:muconolactone delta-isomerase